jgi:transcription initiation factor TFIIH subunit 2
LISDFVDSAEDHCTKLLDFKEFEGNPSLQNSLELACENFRSVPNYASKEVLCVFSSLTNSDPGNIFQTIARLKQDQISCSVISLSA